MGVLDWLDLEIPEFCALLAAILSVIYRRCFCHPAGSTPMWLAARAESRAAASPGG
jgi:hypothetical protein